MFGLFSAVFRVEFVQNRVGKVNGPPHKRSTLINVNLKKEIEEEERFVSGLKNGFLGRHRDPDLQRMAHRAAQEVENALRQAA